ncbi:MAG: fluoride efflux transporter CrcB [Rickettsiales bacterium]|nr:fluoride efflux transporter CrcB [Rickettsiales bacterium]
MIWVYIAIGGALGSVFRYMTILATERFMGHAFPYGTLTVNVLGALIMGIVVGYLQLLNPNGNPQIKSFIVVGLLGGYTTFSSFSLDALTMIQNDHMVSLMLYITLSVGLSLLGIWSGYQIVRGIS